MIADFLDFVVNGVLGLGIGNITLLVSLAALVVYWHRAQSAAAFFGTWLGKIVFAVVVIGVLNAIGVIQEISFARGAELVSALIGFVIGLLPAGIA